MRALTIILLTANLALAAWLFWLKQPEPAPPSPPMQSQPLVLAHEIPQSLPPAQAGDPEPDDSAASPEFSQVEVTCQALGPYLDRPAANRARERLADAGMNPEMREVEIRHRLGYWVFIPPVADRADADAHIEQLREAGIRDFYLVAEGENANALSLGVFGTREAAEQHASRLRALGFEIEIGERRRLVPAWWLDFVAPAPGSQGAALVAELVLESEDALALDSQPCR